MVDSQLLFCTPNRYFGLHRDHNLGTGDGCSSLVVSVRPWMSLSKSYMQATVVWCVSTTQMIDSRHIFCVYRFSLVVFRHGAITIVSNQLVAIFLSYSVLHSATKFPCNLQFQPSFDFPKTSLLSQFAATQWRWKFVALNIQCSTAASTSPTARVSIVERHDLLV